MALLSSVSTLILSLHLDVVTGTQHRPNREIVAQRVGNISGLTEDVRSTLSSLKLLDRVPRENIVADMEDAKEIIRAILLRQRLAIEGAG